MDNKKTIIILHGWGASPASWREVSDALSLDYKVIVPDLPGFGEAPEPQRAWSAGDYADYIHGFAEKRGLRRFVLAGHSFGGRIAIKYALKYSRDLSALVLIDTAGIIRPKRLRAWLFLFLTKIGNLIFKIPFLYFAREWVRSIWYKLTREKDYYRASPLMRETFKKVIEEDFGPQVARINIPTLILWGEDDPATPVRAARVLYQSIPGSKLKIFPGAGHAINLEIPKKVAYAIKSWLSS